jgi:methyl-accepting chemotaxis protein
MRGRITLLKRISDRFRKFAEGEEDLFKRDEVANEDEVGHLGIGFNRFGEKLSELIPKVGQTGRKISSVSSSIMRETRNMAAGVEIQTKAAEAASVSIAQMNSRIKDVSVFSESLADTSRESSDALEQITESII